MLIDLSAQTFFLKTNNVKMQMGKSLNSPILASYSVLGIVLREQFSESSQNFRSLQALEHFSQYSEYELDGTAGK